MHDFLERLLSAPGWAVCLAAGALVFAEDALFVGFVLPGETAAVLAGVVASRGDVSLTAVLLTVIAASVIGDSVGYEVGRKVGPRILSNHRLNGHRERLDSAQDLLARRGGMAVFLGRFVAFFRAVMPALAGASRMPYRKFLIWNAAGGIVWSVAVVLLGFFAGESYAKVESLLGKGVAVVFVALVAVGLVTWKIRGLLMERRAK